MRFRWQDVYQQDHMRLPIDKGFYAVRTYGERSNFAMYMYWNGSEFWKPEPKHRVVECGNNPQWFKRWYGWPTNWAEIPWGEFDWHHQATDPRSKNGLVWVESNKGTHELAYRAGGYFVLSQGRYNGRYTGVPHSVGCYRWAEYERDIKL